MPSNKDTIIQMLIAASYVNFVQINSYLKFIVMLIYV